MSEGVINNDGSRNWQANILFDNVKRLEEENQRLKAENEKLKEKIHKHNSKGFCMCEFSNNLIAENKILKAENERLKKENEELKAEINRSVDFYDEKLTQNIQYKQALEEIREIAKRIVADDDKPSCTNEIDCPLNGGAGYDNHCNMLCPFILGKQIQDKINEVLNNVES